MLLFLRILIFSFCASFLLNPAQAQNPPAHIAGFVFMACVPSVGECANSCPTHAYFARFDEEVCAYDNARQPVACYCKGTDSGERNSTDETRDSETR
jgi:hypothetical protein